MPSFGGQLADQKMRSSWVFLAEWHQCFKFPVLWYRNNMAGKTCSSYPRVFSFENMTQMDIIFWKNWLIKN